MRKYVNKINKCHNIIKKIKGCIKCHKITKTKINNIIKKNIKKNYKEIIKFKYNIRYNINMNKMVINMKNKYIIEIFKYFKKIPNFKKLLKI